jgi:hypothetical protein
MRLTAKLKAASVKDLEKLAKDPRLSARQQQKLHELIQAKKSQEVPTKKPDAKLREEERRELKKAVEADAPKVQENYGWVDADASGISQLKNSYRTMMSRFKEPGWQTTANRARMINLRLLIYQKERELRNKTGPIESKSYEAALKASPKYDKTPGSRKAISKPKAEDVQKLQAHLSGLSKQLDAKDISHEKALEVSNEILNTNRRLMVARGDTKPSSPSLKDIYQEQGFNSKPELVGTLSDLRSRKDVLTHPNGSPIIMYRGVTTVEFADQFKGVGPGGEVHYPGRGIFGNGSYAASASATNVAGSEREAIKTATSYAGERKELGRKVIAFALRKDANVVTFAGADRNEREREYDNWADEVRNRAERETGCRFKDVGEAAAAVGIHAYQVPQRGEDFFVVLNRGAVIAAMDSQIADG